MPTYQASYSAFEPAWGDVRFTSEDSDLEAVMVDAEEEVAKLYPELEDIEIDPNSIELIEND